MRMSESENSRQSKKSFWPGTAAGTEVGAWLKRALGNVEEHTRSGFKKSCGEPAAPALCARAANSGFTALDQPLLWDRLGSLHESGGFTPDLRNIAGKINPLQTHFPCPRALNSYPPVHREKANSYQ